MATETKGIKLVVNGGPVTTGTNAASGILKVLVASKLKGVQVEIENVKQSKSKEVMWADIEGMVPRKPTGLYYATSAGI
ncbi:hypothetical protein AX774_g1426 [Zancudomyces culisetae]|uniref:Uncharacterized protein n=1 Tax=Zancudomyces culisetae TaxID=1213189 RepID=A0A1R1PVP6_ZANCU|nr:hypothetical protein AX774_g1426 [Zancudomyces culisetae]|eukprot:OMH85037.1 hypothetical protein AX774_g1426 [Zancudomyces culisetae]